MLTIPTAAVGYSGVLFTYATLETYHSNVPTRSIFGLFNVPAKLYPWVLLVVLSLMLPGISFLGHLSGILVGIFFVAGGASYLLPSMEFQREVEQYACCSSIYRKGNYVRCTDYPWHIPDFFRSTDGVSGCLRPVLVAIQQIYFLLEALLHICNCPTARISAFVRDLIPSR